ASNADFLGVQMAVHVLLTLDAQLEARALLMSTTNIPSPASGAPTLEASRDVGLDFHWMTRERTNAQGEGMVFADAAEVSRAYYSKQVDLQARVKVRLTETLIGSEGEKQQTTSLVDTTVGRVLLWEIVPQGIPLDMINRPMVKKAISGVLNYCYRVVGLKATVIFADRLMYMGYDFSTKSGSSIGVN